MNGIKDTGKVSDKDLRLFYEICAKIILKQETIFEGGVNYAN